MFGKIKDRLVRAFDISPCVAYKLPDVEMLGNRKIVIENYRSLLIFTDTQIVLKLEHNRFRIQGEHLVIDSYNGDVMIISGHIFNVSFLP